MLRPQALSSRLICMVCWIIDQALLSTIKPFNAISAQFGFEIQLYLWNEEFVQLSNVSSKHKCKKVAQLMSFPLDVGVSMSTTKTIEIQMRKLYAWKIFKTIIYLARIVNGKSGQNSMRVLIWNWFLANFLAFTKSEMFCSQFERFYVQVLLPSSHRQARKSIWQTLRQTTKKVLC